MLLKHLGLEQVNDCPLSLDICFFQVFFPFPKEFLWLSKEVPLFLEDFAPLPALPKDKGNAPKPKNF
jgi:hypothetical protein